MMTKTDKAFIRKRIKQASGMDLGEVFPEAFVTEKRGGVVTSDFTDLKFPHTKSAFVNLGPGQELVGEFKTYCVCITGLN